MLGLSGWFSTNILGNRDGGLGRPGPSRPRKNQNFPWIRYNRAVPELYSELYHKVRINYYPPRGDAKAGILISLAGLATLQIKVNFLCRDSILATDARPGAVFGSRNVGMYGTQE